jgi:hypothetical protein
MTSTGGFVSKSKELRGEGNYDAAKEFDDAEPKNEKEKEKEKMERAEEKGRQHAEDEDPQYLC